MKTKIKISVFLILLIMLFSTIGTTYSRYSSSVEGNISTTFARWKILVNSENITSNYSSSLIFTPVIDTNLNVAANKIAPGSTGYFDIEIDPTDVDVSFTYTIALSLPNTNEVSDLNITDYAIASASDFSSNNSITKTAYSGSAITNNILYDNNTENFAFQPFVVRVYFEWDDTNTANMNDQADTAIGLKVANGEDISFDLFATINFTQYTGSQS